MESVPLVNYFDLIKCRACAQQKEMEGSRDMIINMNNCFGCTVCLCFHDEVFNSYFVSILLLVSLESCQ